MIEPVQELKAGSIGTLGPQGLSAYQIYLANGGTLSETEWLKSLKGEKGDQGEQGEQGIQGIQGLQGETGQDGYTPVKGTDYWTEEDKNEIKSYCDSLITGVLGGSY